MDAPKPDIRGIGMLNARVIADVTMEMEPRRCSVIIAAQWRLGTVGEKVGRPCSNSKRMMLLLIDPLTVRRQSILEMYFEQTELK